MSAARRVQVIIHFFIHKFLQNKNYDAWLHKHCFSNGQLLPELGTSTIALGRIHSNQPRWSGNIWWGCINRSTILWVWIWRNLITNTVWDLVYVRRPFRTKVNMIWACGSCQQSNRIMIWGNFIRSKVYRPYTRRLAKDSVPTTVLVMKFYCICRRLWRSRCSYQHGWDRLTWRRVEKTSIFSSHRLSRRCQLDTCMGVARKRPNPSKNFGIIWCLPLNTPRFRKKGFVEIRDDAYKF